MYPIQYSQRSRFVTVLAIVSLASAFFSLAQNFSTLSMQSSSEFEIVQSLLPSGMIPATEIYFEILLNIAALIVSVALFMRSRKGRIAYMIVLGIYAVWELYSGISSYYRYNDLLAGMGFGKPLSLILFWSVIGMGITVFILWKLSTPEIKSEFENYSRD